MSRARNEKRKLGEFNTHTEDKRSRGKQRLTYLNLYKQMDEQGWEGYRATKVERCGEP